MSKVLYKPGRGRDPYRPTLDFIPGTPPEPEPVWIPIPIPTAHRAAPAPPAPAPPAPAPTPRTPTIDETLWRGSAPTHEDPWRYHTHRLIELDRETTYRGREDPGRHLTAHTIRYLASHIALPANANALGAELGRSRRAVAHALRALTREGLLVQIAASREKLGARPAGHARWYLSDTGLAARALGIRTPDQLAAHPLRAALFENYVVMALAEARLARGTTTNDLGHWTLRNGHSITLLMPGLIIDRPQRHRNLTQWMEPRNPERPYDLTFRTLKPYEIQPGRHPGGGLMPVFVQVSAAQTELFRKRLEHVKRLAQGRLGPVWIIHAQDVSFIVRNVRCISWRDLAETQALLDPSSVIL